MDLKLSDDQFRALVHKAILDAMSPESRDTLIRDGIAKVLTADRGNQYDKRSELQQIFDRAVQDVARKLVDDMLATDPAAVESIRGVVVEGFARAFTDARREKTVDRVADAITTAIWKDSY